MPTSTETVQVSRLPREQSWRRVLTEQMGASAADALLQAAGAQFEAQVAARARLPRGALRRHLLGSILPGLALYRALLNAGLEQEAALARMDQLFEQDLAPRRRQLERLGRSPLYYYLVRLVVPWQIAHSFPAVGWQTEWRERSGRRVAFDMHRCYYLDTLRTYDAPELTAVFCRIDDTVYGNVSPHVRWGRSQTLGQGGACCDFSFERVRPA